MGIQTLTRDTSSLRSGPGGLDPVARYTDLISDYPRTRDYAKAL